MKSHWCAGQHTLNGKKHKTLGCGCCTVSDLREKHAKQYEHKDMQERLVDDYSYEEFMGDTCMQDGEPCELCKAAAERAMRSNAALRGDSGLIAGVPLESTVMQEED